MVFKGSHHTLASKVCHVIPNEQETTHALVGGWTNPFQKYYSQIGAFPHHSHAICSNPESHLHFVLKLLSLSFLISLLEFFLSMRMNLAHGVPDRHGLSRHVKWSWVVGIVCTFLPDSSGFLFLGIRSLSPKYLLCEGNLPAWSRDSFQEVESNLSSVSVDHPRRLKNNGIRLSTHLFGQAKLRWRNGPWGAWSKISHMGIATAIRIKFLSSTILLLKMSQCLGYLPKNWSLGRPVSSHKRSRKVWSRRSTKISPEVFFGHRILFTLTFST